MTALNKSSYEKMVSNYNSIFFEKKGVVRNDSFLLKKYIIPLEEKNLILYCFKKILYNYNADSATLQNDTYAELMTMKTLSNFKPFDKSTKYFSDSLYIAANLPGYAMPLNEEKQFQSVHYFKSA